MAYFHLALLFEYFYTVVKIWFSQKEQKAIIQLYKYNIVKVIFKVHYLVYILIETKLSRIQYFTYFFNLNLTLHLQFWSKEGKKKQTNNRFIYVF